MSRLVELVKEYKDLGITEQIDYEKLYMYSIVTNSTAVEGSTITEIENMLMFDEGISPNRSLAEQLMNLDLKNAYVEAFALAEQHTDYSVRLLCHLAAMVMNNTGTEYNTLQGKFNSAKGEEFCTWLNFKRNSIDSHDIDQVYELSFMAHYNLVSIHPWADGNGRMSRLLMNMIQTEYGMIPSVVKKEVREEYIKALSISQDDDNPEKFMEFMFNHHQNNLELYMSEYKDSLENDRLDFGI